MRGDEQERKRGEGGKGLREQRGEKILQGALRGCGGVGGGGEGMLVAMPTYGMKEDEQAKSLMRRTATYQSRLNNQSAFLYLQAEPQHRLSR